MRVLITGITSIHGWPIYLLFKKKYGASCVYGVYPPKMKKYFNDFTNIDSCEIEDKERLKNIVAEVNPCAVIHAGGVCDLDLCEDDPDFAYNVNVCGAQNIVNIISDNTYLMYISSDLVFSGKNPPVNGYSETCEPDPISVVGKTYLKAEKEILKKKDSAVVRIGLPLGDSISGTKGARDFITKRLRENKNMTLFYDEVRSVLCTSQLASGISELFDRKISGIHHFGGDIVKSLYEIGKDIVKENEYNEKYLICASKEDEINGPPRIGNVSLKSSYA